MSTILMSACWPLEMSPSQKIVLILLADNANDDGICWPSLETICERTCLSERAVRNAITWLEECGALQKFKRGGRSAVYKVDPGGFTAPCKVLGVDDAPRHEVPPGTRCRPARDAAHPGTRCRLPRHEVPVHIEP